MVYNMAEIYIQYNNIDIIINVKRPQLSIIEKYIKQKKKKFENKKEKQHFKW